MTTGSTAGSAASSAVEIAGSIWGMVASIKAARAWEASQADQRRATVAAIADERNAYVDAAGSAAHRTYSEVETDLTGMFARNAPLFTAPESNTAARVIDYAVPAVAVLGLVGLFIYLKVSR